MKKSILIATVASVLLVVAGNAQTTVSGTIDGHDYVDLGLSVKWATCNVGALRPSDYGNYYAWGETSHKSTYTDENCTAPDCFGNISGMAAYDAAFANWGVSWRMPTKAEMQELIDKCTWTWTNQGGHNGYKVTSKTNGNSIFLPAAGWRNGSSLDDAGEMGGYWSSTPDRSYLHSSDVYYLDFESGDYSVFGSCPCDGKSVRPVCDVNTQDCTTVTGSINCHEYVDLGLTVKWATCNVGASSPSDYGNYYAWGETTTKSEYTKENCKTWEKNIGDISGNSNYDVARANWGGLWRMPTKEEIQELIDKCTWTWTNQGGHNGYKVTSKTNGNSIFLPAAGWHNESSLDYAGVIGGYWSSSLYESDIQRACILYLNIRNLFASWNDRCCGQSIRPVSD